MPQTAPSAIEPAPSQPPAANDVAVVCPNIESVRSETKFPAKAMRFGLSGETLIEFTVGPDGEVKNLEVVHSTNHVFDSASLNAVKQLGCIGRGQDVRVQAPFAFNFRE